MAGVAIILAKLNTETTTFRFVNSENSLGNHNIRDGIHILLLGLRREWDILLQSR